MTAHQGDGRSPAGRARLFYWVLNDIARHTSDAQPAAHLTEIDRENLG